MRDWMNWKHLNLLAIPLAGAMLGGCGSEEDMQALLAKASAELAVIPGGRGTIPLAERSEGPYAEVRKILQPVLESENSAEKAAAHLIIGEIELAEATAQLRLTTEKQREALERVMEIEARVNVWQVAETRQALAASFDASNERQKLGTEIQVLDASIAKEQQTLAGMRTELDAINSQILELNAQAETERGEVAKLEIQADSADPMTALPLITEAQRHSRLADGFIMQAEKLRGQIERLAPKIDRQELRIKGEQSARQVRTEDLSDLTESEQFHEQQAREASSEATTIRNEVIALLFGSDGLAAFYDGALQQAMSDADDAFEQAYRAARSGSELRQQSQLLTGRVRQAQAQGLLNQAREVGRFRKTLGRLASTEALASGEPRIASKLTELRQIEIDAFTAASNAIQEAADAFSSAGMRGEAQDFADALQAELAESRQAADDQITDLGGQSSGG